MYGGQGPGGGPAHQPDYPAALGSLQHLGSEQLKDILNNEDKFDEFIRELPQMKALQEEKEMLLTSNRSLAEYNLSQEPVVREGRARLQTKHQAARRLGEQVRALKEELDTKQGNLSPDTLLALLEAANQEAEEESEQMTEDFLSSSGQEARPLEEFLEQYGQARRLAHLRRVKVEKLKEQAGQGGGRGTPVRAAPPPPGGQAFPGGSRAPGYPAQALPYPSHPQYNMPMPPGYRP